MNDTLDVIYRNTIKSVTSCIEEAIGPITWIILMLLLAAWCQNFYQ